MSLETGAAIGLIGVGFGIGYAIIILAFRTLNPFTQKRILDAIGKDE